MSKAIWTLVMVSCVSRAFATEPLDIQPYRDAYARFATLLTEGGAGTPTALRSPEFKRLVATLTDERRFLRARPFGQNDLPVVMELCEITRRANAALLGFAPTGDEAQVFKDKDLQLLKNSRDFQPETGALLAFHIRCLGASVPLLEQLVSTMPAEQLTPKRRMGLAAMRDGYSEMLAGTIGSISDGRYTMQYRGTILKAIADTSPEFASMLTLEQRARMLDRMKATTPTAPEKFSVEIERVTRALEAKECGAVCAVN